MTSWNNVIEKYVVKAVTTAPLHIGNAIGDSGEVLVHPVTDSPFLQASGLTGVLRSASMTLYGIETTEKLFGSLKMDEDMTAQTAGSRVRISDGEFVMETVHLENRPRVAIDPVSGSVGSSRISGSRNASGQKYEAEYIGTGAEFSFVLYLFHNDSDDDRNRVEEILSEMAAGHLQIGGQKSNGAGFLKAYKLLHKTFMLENEPDRISWAKEHSMTEGDYDEITEKMDSRICPAYDIKVTGRTEGPILIRSACITAFGAGAADVENLKNAGGQYIIPGSSIKGALRNRIVIIEKYLGKKGISDSLFGFAGKQEQRGSRGTVIVCDSVIGGESGNVREMLQHRIHIDKFTGGVMQTGLFTEQTLSGDILLHILVDHYGNPEAALGMLLLAIRDLAGGLWNLGSGYGVGRGYITVDKVTVTRSGSEKAAVISFSDNRISDPAGIMKSCLEAVGSWKEE